MRGEVGSVVDDDFASSMGGATKVGLVSVAGALCIYYGDKIIPITVDLLKELGWADAETREVIARQKAIADSLIKNREMIDEKWLREHTKFISTTGESLGDWPEKVIAHLYEQLQYPSGQRRIANMYAMARIEANGKHSKVSPESVSINFISTRMSHGSATGSGPDLHVDTFVKDSDSFYNGTLAHENTHQGQLFLANYFHFSPREYAVYDDIKETFARIEEYCNGVIEGRNAEGFCESKDLKTILAEIDPKMSWDDFLKLQQTNPKKFDAYMGRMKTSVFKRLMEFLPGTTHYNGALLQYATVAKDAGGKGNIRNLKRLCQEFAKQENMNFNDIWPTIRDYATGKVDLPGLAGCFDAQGNLTPLGVQRHALIEYKNACEALELAERQPSHESLSKMWEKTIEERRLKLLEVCPELKYLEESKGHQWLMENFDAALKIVEHGTENVESALGVLSKRTVEVDGKTRVQYDLGCRLVETDEQGHVLTSCWAHSPDQKFTFQYDPKGKVTAVVTPQGKILRDMEDMDDIFGAIQEVDRIRKVEEIKGILSDRGFSVEDGIGGNVRVHTEVQVPSAKKQVMKTAGVFVGQAAVMLIAGEAGRRAQNWDDARKKHHVGELMGITPDTTTAMNKAGTYLGVAGLAIAGASFGVSRAAKSVKWAKSAAMTGKALPLLGSAVGVGFAAARAWDGDWAGAGLEMVSAGLSLGPGVLTAADVALNGYMAYRDGQMKNGTYDFTMLDEKGNAVKTENGDELVGAKINYKNNLEDGPASFYSYDPEKGPYLSVIGNFKNGERDGQWVTVSPNWDKRHPNDHVLERANYENGKLISFDRVDEEGHLVAQLKDGQYIEYWTDENGISTGKTKCIGRYENGERIGRWITVSPEWDIKHPEEHVLECANFENDRLAGEYFRLDANENIIAQGNFSEGEYKEYWTNESGLSTGIPKYEGQYQNGQGVGRWLAHSPDGEVAAEIDYDQKEIYQYTTKTSENGIEQKVVNTIPFFVPSLSEGTVTYPSSVSMPPEIGWANSVHNPVPMGLTAEPTQNPKAESSFPKLNPAMKPQQLSLERPGGSFGNHRGLDDQLGASPQTQFGNDEGLDNAIAQEGTDASEVESTETSQKPTLSRNRGRKSSHEA